MKSSVAVGRCAEVKVDFELDSKSLYHPAYFFLGSDLKGYKTKQYKALFQKKLNNWFIEGNGEIKSCEEWENNTPLTHSFFNNITLSDSYIDKGVENKRSINPRSASIGISACNDESRKDIALFNPRYSREDKGKKPDVTLVIVLYREATFDRLLEAIYRKRKRKFSILARFSKDQLYPGQHILFSDNLDDDGIDRGPFTLHHNYSEKGAENAAWGFWSEMKFLDM